jgi:rRNA maturation endonuclease Nob1
MIVFAVYAVVGVYAIVGVLLVALGLGLYLFAVQSRKAYQCNVCGERTSVEHMAAHHCGMCGAPFKEDTKK